MTVRKVSVSIMQNTNHHSKFKILVRILNRIYHSVYKINFEIFESMSC